MEKGLIHSFIHSLDRFIRPRPCPGGLATPPGQEGGEGNSRAKVPKHLNPTLPPPDSPQSDVGTAVPDTELQALSGCGASWHTAGLRESASACGTSMGSSVYKADGGWAPPDECTAQRSWMAAFGGTFPGHLPRGWDRQQVSGASVLLPLHTSSCHCLARPTQEVRKPGPKA